MGRVVTVIVYFLGAAILVGAAAYWFNDRPADVAPVSAISDQAPVDNAGRDEIIDMAALMGGTEGLQKRRIERAMMEARYQQERTAMAGEPEEEIARLDRRHLNDREEMRQRHEAEAQVEAQVEAAESGTDADGN